MHTSTSPTVSVLLAQADLAERRLQAPSRAANSARNARAEIGRRQRWRPARDALWRFLDPHLGDGASVAILGAGNGDDLPLDRIAERGSAVTLLDLDPQAARGARRRQSRAARRKISVLAHDVTAGVADAIVLAALRGEVPERTGLPEGPLPGSPYDFVIGDLFYSQLLYPAMADLGVAEPRQQAFLARYGPALTRSVVARLHASAPLGRVAHIHDPIAWWPGHSQPVSIEDILASADSGDPEGALAIVARGLGPAESDPRAAVRSLGMAVLETRLWRWPFAPGVEYLACATLAGDPR